MNTLLAALLELYFTGPWHLIQKGNHAAGIIMYLVVWLGTVWLIHHIITAKPTEETVEDKISRADLNNILMQYQTREVLERIEQKLGGRRF